MKVVYNWNDYLLLWMVSFYASNLQAEVSMQYVCIYIYVCVLVADIFEDGWYWKQHFIPKNGGLTTTG